MHKSAVFQITPFIQALNYLHQCFIKNKYLLSEKDYFVAAQLV
jgi:hypothetical protein